jgi:hypothetical protein
MNSQKIAVSFGFDPRNLPCNKVLSVRPVLCSITRSTAPSTVRLLTAPLLFRCLQRISPPVSLCCSEFSIPTAYGVCSFVYCLHSKRQNSKRARILTSNASVFSYFLLPHSSVFYLFIFLLPSFVFLSFLLSFHLLSNLRKLG